MAADWNLQSTLLHDDTREVTESKFLAGDGHETEALAVNRTGDQAIVAGSSAFRLVRFKDGVLIDKNLRNKRVRGFGFKDVIWHHAPGFEACVVSGSSQGIVSIWNLETSGKEQVDHLESLLRSISKVQFNPLDPNVIIAGTYGGTIEQWDLRTKQTTGARINANKPICNLAFSPHDKDLFASAAEDGVLAIYDRRKGTTPVSQSLRHDGPIYALAWHPYNRGELATGGRDKAICILDTNADLKVTQSFNAMSSVRRIAWDPTVRHQLACCYLSELSMEQKTIDIWNLKRPHFPFSRLTDQKEAVAGFVWSHGQPTKLMLSVSKKGNVCRHAVANADIPHCTIGLQCAGFAWSASPHCTIFSKVKPPAASARASTRSIRADSLAKPMAAQVQSKVTVLPTHQTSSRLVPLACLADNARHQLIGELAEEYSLDHTQPKRTCQHNAEVARRHQLDSIVQLWTMLQLVLLDSLEQSASPSSGLQVAQVAEEEEDELQPEAIEDLVLEDVKTEPFESRQLDEASSGEDEVDEPNQGARRFLANSNYEMSFSLGKNQQRVINNLPAISAEVAAFKSIRLLVDAINYYADHDDIQLAVVLLIVFQDLITKDDVTLNDQEAMFLGYEEQLDVLQLWGARGIFLRACPLSDVQGLSDQGTTMITACSACQGAVSNGVCTSPNCAARTYVDCKSCPHMFGAGGVAMEDTVTTLLSGLDYLRLAL